MFVYLLKGFGSGQAVYPHHDEMFKAGGSVQPKLRLCRLGNSNVSGRSTRRPQDWFISDIAENVVLIRSPDVIGEDEFSFYFLLVAAERCGRE